MISFPLCMRIYFCVSLSLLLTGCATNLQRADQLFAEARYEAAIRYYLREYDEQRRSAALPKWENDRYRYKFNVNNAAAGLLGAAKSADAMGKDEQATLWRARLAAFCQRHSLPMNWTTKSD